MLDKNLIQILDELLPNFDGKDANIVCHEFSDAGLFTYSDCELINAHILFCDKFTVMFRLLTAKDEQQVFRKMQEICVKQKWLDMLSIIQFKLNSVQRLDLCLTVWEQQQIHNPFMYGINYRVELFIGRKEHLNKMHELLDPSSDFKHETKSDSSRPVLVSGLGGVGKTQLVLKYIEDYCLEYDSIVWINSESEASITESFIELAETLRVSEVSKDIKTIVAVVYRKLSRIGSRNLVVFDNADNFIPNQFWPSVFEKFFVIVTSRYQNWPKFAQIKVDIFKDEEANSFIKLSLNDENYDSDREVTSLASVLQNFPLALGQAVDYIRHSHEEESFLNSRFTINDYLKKYDSYMKRYLMNYQARDMFNNLNVVTTLNTWSVTVEKLKKMRYNTDTAIKQDTSNNEEPLQIKILHLISYMADEKIDPNLFLEVANGDKKYLQWAVNRLILYSMVYIAKVPIGSTNKLVFLNVHKLVQQVTRLRLEEDGQEEQTFKVIFGILHTAFPLFKETSKDNIAKQRELLPHLVAFKFELEIYAKKCDTKCRIQQKFLKPVLTDIQDGTFKNTKDFAQEGIKKALITEDYYGPEHFKVATTLGNLSNAYGELGDPRTQKILLERALKIKKNHYGYDHFEVARTLTNLANAYGALGEPKTQKNLLEKALKIKENYYGDDHFEVAKTLANLSNAYGSLGDPKTQKILLEKALKIAENHYGSDHFEVTRILENLSNAYGDLGNPKIQILLERVLKIEEIHYGSDHFEVAKTLVNLSNAYYNLGDPKSQKILLERALKIEENHYGPDHFEVAITLVNLGNVHGALGDPKSQKILLERALKIEKNHYGSDHFELAKTLGNLANAYGDLGDSEMKKDLLERALRIQENHYGSDHFEVAKTLGNLANAYGNLGNLRMKKSLLERALRIQENHYDPDHFEVSKTLGNLASVYGDLRDSETKRNLLERVLKIKENHYGPDHFEVAKTLGNLSNAYGELRDLKMKKYLLERALKIKENHYGPDHFEVAITLVNLATAHGALGESEKEKILLEGIKNSRKSLWP